MKALVIGKSNYNITTVVDKLPVSGEKIDINEVYESGDGSGANVAYLLGKFGIDTYFSSVVGDDSYGSSIKKELDTAGVHTEYMETSYEKKSPFVFTLIEKESKNKIVNNVEKEHLLLKKSEIQTDVDLVYTDGTDYGASLSNLNKYANKITVIGAKKCDKEIFELCKYCKYIIASREFAEWVSGTKIDFNNPGSLVTVYSSMLNKLVKKEIVITLGDKGALYIANNQIKVMPGLKNDILDSSGSGDYFRGAFLYALLQNYDIEKAVTFANIAGGLTATKMGVRESLPPLSEVLTYFNQKYGITNDVPNQTESIDSLAAPEGNGNASN